MSTFTTTVNGRRPNAGSPQSWWHGTGRDVNQGDTLTFSATGAINPGFGPSFDPNGQVGNEQNKRWDAALAFRSGGTRCWFGSLIGKIGTNGTAFCIGANKTMAAPATGRLYLAFNDGVSFQDNNGSWNVSITLGQPVNIPVGRCTIRINPGHSKSAYTTPGAVNRGRSVAIIPQGAQVLVYGRWGSNNLIVLVEYQGRKLWIDSSSHVTQITGDCSHLSLIPEVDPASYCRPRAGETCVNIYTDTPQVILAHVLYAEANSMGAIGMANVAQVIRNRKAHEGRRNILSVVLAEDPSVNSEQRYTFVGLARPADRTQQMWSPALVLAQQLLNGSSLTPLAVAAVRRPDVIYYCSTNERTASNAAHVHRENDGRGNYHIFRNVSQGACQ